MSKEVEQRPPIAKEGKYLIAFAGLEFLTGAVIGAISLLTANEQALLGAAALIGSSSIQFLVIGHGLRVNKQL